MSPTRRWLESGEQLPRELLEALRHAPGEPTPTQLRELSASVGAALKAFSGPATAAQVASRVVENAAKPVAVAVLTKPSFIVGLWALGGLGVGAALAAFAYSFAQPARDGASQAVEPPASTEPAPAASAERAPFAERSAAPAATDPRVPSPAAVGLRSASGARALPTTAGQGELELLRRAQAAVESDPGLALRLVNEHARRFDSGLFRQEREVIAIDATLRQGDASAALRRIEAFRKRYPGSAHIPRLDALFERYSR